MVVVMGLVMGFPFEAQLKRCAIARRSYAPMPDPQCLTLNA